MSADTIKEFLVALGFKVDEKGLKKFESGIGKATKVAATLGTAAIAAATAVEASVLKISADLDRLYFSSKRTNSAAQNINAFGYAVKQLGGSAESALGSLENFAAFTRNTPAAEKFLQGMGVATRDNTGKMRENLSILQDVGRVLATMRDNGKQGLAVQYGNVLGIDERTLMALQDGTLLARMDQYRKAMRELGYDADKTAAKFHDFEQKSVGPLAAKFEAFTNILGERFLPLAKGITAFIDWLIHAFLWLDKATNGVTTAWATMAAVIGGSLAALAAVGVPVLAFLAGIPIAIAAAVIALGTALGLAASYVIRHWSPIKEWFVSFFGWFEEKFKWFSKTYDRVFYRMYPNAPGAPGNDVKTNPAPLTGGGDRGAALKYFESMGWTSAQAAGIVSNLIHESALNPGAVGDGGKAYGLAQWHPDRQAEFAKVFGKDIRNASFEEQLAFINHELTKGNEQRAGKALRGTSDAYSAGDIVNRLYERSANIGQNSYLRGNTAAQLAQGNAGNTATINQKTDIHVTGSGDPRATAQEVARNQGWVNSTLVRNTQSNML